MSKAITLLEAQCEERRLWAKFQSAVLRMNAVYIEVGLGNLTRDEAAEEIAAVAATMDAARRAWEVALRVSEQAVYDLTTKRVA